MYSFRPLINRLDTTVSSWKGFNLLAFIVIGLKRFLKLKKSRRVRFNNPITPKNTTKYDKNVTKGCFLFCFNFANLIK